MKRKQKRIGVSLVLVMLMVLLTSIPLVAHDQVDAIANAEEWQVLQQINKERMGDGALPLSTFGSLQQAGRVRATELIQLFSHDRPDGSKCYTALDAEGIEYFAAGENIAAGQQTPSAVMTAWMNSDGHRKNILNSNYAHVGVGYQTGGDYGTNWVQLFMNTNCSVTALTIHMPNDDGRYPAGTAIEDMDIAVEATCDKHGACYLPLIAEMCSGYQATAEGSQTVAVRYGEVTASFDVQVGDDAETPDDPKPVDKMTDVQNDDWFYGAVNFVMENNIMNGISATKFDPYATMSRAMVATVLYRLAGEPATVFENIFYDVPNNEWYSKAIVWTSRNSIVNGYGDGYFGSGDDITREQLAAMLYRYADFMGYDVSKRADLSAYSDRGQVGDWAETAMAWAVGEELINGITSTTLEPQGKADRAQGATILMRFTENIAK